MATRVLHELLITGGIQIETRQKTVDPREGRTRPRAYVVLLKPAGHTELYYRFFLEQLYTHVSMWLWALVLRSRAILENDSDRFKELYVKPVLIAKNYLNAFSRPAAHVKEWLNVISSDLDAVEEHVQHTIDPVFIADKLSRLGTNIILLSPETRQKLRMNLPEIQMAAVSSAEGYELNGFIFSGIEFSSHTVTFDDPSGFDGFGGGDFDGGGVDGDW